MSEPSYPESVGEPSSVTSTGEPASPEPPEAPAPTENPSPGPDASSPQVKHYNGSSGAGLRRYRISAVIVIALAVGLIAWLVLRDNGSSTPTSTASNATAASVGQLQALATSVGHPIFWAGPKTGYTYELAQSSDGSIYVRYLPQGVKVGTGDPYLTVATYPFPGAYAAIQTVAQQSGTTAIPLANNGLAETTTAPSTSVHAAYQGVDYQAEVFDPTPGSAEELVRSGALATVGPTETGSTAPTASSATSPAGLKALAVSLGHPIYWAGTKQGYTYELAQTSNGQVTVRYLPPGTAPGASGGYLTVGTYPYPKAFEAIQGLAAEPNAVVIKLAGGGLAVVDKASATNIHLAYPGSDYQIEVYDPSPAAARKALTSGRLKSVG